MDDDSYRYTIGVFGTYAEVRTIKNELIRNGVVGAKVIPYMNDQPIESSKLEELRLEYSDLNEYIKFESK